MNILVLIGQMAGRRDSRPGKWIGSSGGRLDFGRDENGGGQEKPAREAGLVRTKLD